MLDVETAIMLLHPLLLDPLALQIRMSTFFQIRLQIADPTGSASSSR